MLPGGTIARPKTPWCIAAADSPSNLRAVAQDVASATSAQTDIATALARGKRVQLCEGTYTLSNTLGGSGVFVAGSRLEGDGYQTLLKITGAVAGLHVVNVEGAADGTRLAGVAIRNLRIQGYGDDGGSTLHHGLRFKFCSEGLIEGVWVHDATFGGVVVADCDGFTGSDLHIPDGTLGTNGGWYGVVSDNQASADPKAGHRFTNVVTGVIEHGFATNTSDDVAVAGLTMRNGRNDYALNITASKRVIATDVNCIDCHGYVFIEQGSVGCSVKGLRGEPAATAHGQNGIFVSASTDCTIEDFDIDLTGQTSGNGLRADATSDGLKVAGGAIRNAVTRGLYYENGLDYGVCESTEVHDTTGGPGFQFGTGIGLRANDLLSEGNSGDGFVLAGVRATQRGLYAISNGGAGFSHQFMDDSTLDGVALSNTGYGFDAGNAASNSERNRLSGKAAVPSFLNTAGAVRASTATGAAANKYDIDGYTLANSGTGTINSGATTATVTHGLSVTPTINQITITLGENPTNDVGLVWVDTIGATTFRVNCRADPGASNLDFGWKVAP